MCLKPSCSCTIMYISVFTVVCTLLCIHEYLLPHHATQESSVALSSPFSNEDVSIGPPFCAEMHNDMYSTCTSASSPRGSNQTLSSDYSSSDELGNNDEIYLEPFVEFDLDSFHIPNVDREPLFTMISKLIIPAQAYDCCVNDCVIFRNSLAGNFQDLQECPQCREPRFHKSSKIARKNFKYLSMAHRIKQMLSNKKMSQMLQSHTSSRAENMVS